MQITLISVSSLFLIISILIIIGIIEIRIHLKSLSKIIITLIGVGYLLKNLYNKNKFYPIKVKKRKNIGTYKKKFVASSQKWQCKNCKQLL